MAQKKITGSAVAAKRQLIEPNHEVIALDRQCHLVGLSRSAYYYRSAKDDRYNDALMKLIGEQYTQTPFYGVARMTQWLLRQGHWVNAKRIRRLMRLMDLVAIYPKSRLSRAMPEHTVYPYLLRDMVIDAPDQVWCAGITYIRMVQGFVYLVAIMDWYSRYVVAWEISLTLDKAFCIVALERALTMSKPGIFNTDQGAQFTSREFTGTLAHAGIRISMDGRGRVFDNIFIERLWRTVKYEEVYLHEYRMVSGARRQLDRYFRFYNAERIHEALGYRTPSEVYFKEPARMVYSP